MTLTNEDVLDSIKRRNQLSPDDKVKIVAQCEQKKCLNYLRAKEIRWCPIKYCSARHPDDFWKCIKEVLPNGF
jgi:hypothetical protein